MSDDERKETRGFNGSENNLTLFKLLEDLVKNNEHHLYSPFLTLLSGPGVMPKPNEEIMICPLANNIVPLQYLF